MDYTQEYELKRACRKVGEAGINIKINISGMNINYRKGRIG